MPQKIVVVFLVFFLIACEKNHSHSKDTFTYRTGADPSTFDWTYTEDNLTQEIIMNMMSGLLELTPKGDVAPALAESFSVSANGLVWTFRLRQNVKWSDGTPVRVEDFLYSWQRLLTPENASPNAYYMFDVKGAEDFYHRKISDFSKVGIKKIEDRTLQIELKKPTAYFRFVPAIQALFPLRKDLLDKFGKDWTKPENLVVTGAYLLKKWEHDQKVLLERNPLFWGDVPFFKFAQVLIVQDASTALHLFEKGKIDFMSGPPATELDRLRSKNAVHTHTYLRTFALNFNTSKPGVQDARVRRALALSLDREEIVRTLKGGQKVLSSWLPEGVFAHDPKIGLQKNVVQAKKLLNEVRTSTKTELPKMELVTELRESTRNVVEMVQHQWKKNLGIEVDLRAVEVKMMYQITATDAPPIYRGGWIGDFPDPHNYMAAFLNENVVKATHWQNAKYADLLENAAHEINLEKRKKMYDEAQKILLEQDVITIPLFQEAMNYVVRPDLKSFEIDPMGFLFIRTFK